MYRKRLVCLMFCIGSALFSCVQSANAGILYAFDQANYSVAAGGEVTVNLYLRETFDVGDTTYLDTDGLFSVGARIAFAGAVGVTDPAQILSVAGNPAFDGSTVVDIDPGVSAGIAEYVDFFSPSVTVSTGMGFNELLIGSFTFRAGNIAGEVTELRAIDFSTSSIETLTGDPSLLFLDPDIAASTATITVDGNSIPAVPEPSSIVVALVLSMGFLVQRNYKNRFC